MKTPLIVIVMVLLFVCLFSAKCEADNYQSNQIFVDAGFLSMTFYTMLVDPGHGGPARLSV